MIEYEFARADLGAVLTVVAALVAGVWLGVVLTRRHYRLDADLMWRRAQRAERQLTHARDELARVRRTAREYRRLTAREHP